MGITPTDGSGSGSGSEQLPPPLTAADKDSFAFPTMSDRVPVIICKVIDRLYRSRNDPSRSDEEKEALKEALDRMAQLRYELQTNKPMTPLKDHFPNTAVWNRYLQEQEEKSESKEVKWFETSWLYAECYAYRRLLEAMSLPVTSSASSPPSPLADEDYFRFQKRESFQSSLDAVRNMVAVLETVRKEAKEQTEQHFQLMLKISLWGNKCDLSISSGSNQAFEGNPASRVANLEPNILADDTGKVWTALKASSDKKVIDIVLDNAAFELMSDLCLADFLVEAGLALKVRLRVKNQPWFVSDTMEHDIYWTLDQMDVDHNSTVKDASKRWRRYLAEKVWTVHSDDYWTYPHDFSSLKSVDPALYLSLSEADLVIFKGDLNYRKLVGDLQWETTVSFERALRHFHPAPIVTLRTLKADVVTGLREGQKAEMEAKDKGWMSSGDWAVIQFCDRVEKAQ